MYGVLLFQPFSSRPSRRTHPTIHRRLLKALPLLSSLLHFFLFPANILVILNFGFIKINPRTHVCNVALAYKSRVVGVIASSHFFA
jgi:hypothetical protein